MNKRFESLLISATLLSPVALVTTSQLATTVQADTFDKIPPTSQSDIDKALDYIKDHPYDAGDTHGKIVLQKNKPIVYPNKIIIINNKHLPQAIESDYAKKYTNTTYVYHLHLYMHEPNGKVSDLTYLLNGSNISNISDIFFTRKSKYIDEKSNIQKTITNIIINANNPSAKISLSAIQAPIGIEYEGRKVATHKHINNSRNIKKIDIDVSYYFKRANDITSNNDQRSVKIRYYDFKANKCIHTQILTGKQGSTINVNYDKLPKNYYYLNSASVNGGITWTKIFPYNYLFLLYGNKYTFTNKNPEIFIPVINSKECKQYNDTDTLGTSVVLDNKIEYLDNLEYHSYKIKYIDAKTGNVINKQKLYVPENNKLLNMIPTLYPTTEMVADNFINGTSKPYVLSQKQFIQAVKAHNYDFNKIGKSSKLSLGIYTYRDPDNLGASSSVWHTMYIAVDSNHSIIHPIDDPTLSTQSNIMHSNPIDPNANKGKNKADNVPLAKHSPVDANANKGVKKTIQPTNVSHSSTQSSSVTNSNNNSAQAKSTSSQSTNALSQQPNLNQSTNSINTDQSQKLNQNQLVNDQFKSSNDSNKVVNDSTHDVPTSEPEKEKSKPVKEKSTTESAQSQPASKQSVTQGSSNMQKPSKTNELLPQTGENKPVLGTLIAIFSGTILTLLQHFQIRKH